MTANAMRTFMPLERCLYGVSRKSPMSANSMISSNFASICALRHAVQARGEVDVVAHGEVVDEAAGDLDERRDAARDLDRALVGDHDARRRASAASTCPGRCGRPRRSPRPGAPRTTRCAAPRTRRDGCGGRRPANRSLKMRRPRRLRRNRMPSPSVRIARLVAGEPAVEASVIRSPSAPARRLRGTRNRPIARSTSDITARDRDVEPVELSGKNAGAVEAEDARRAG